MNKANYRECPKCQGHLYAVYIGGAKIKLDNQYYCKKCKTIAQIEFMVYSQTKPNPSFFTENVIDQYGIDLKSQNELIEELQIEEERVFN